jgi:peptide/nickel transport system ATP-binding protein
VVGYLPQNARSSLNPVWRIGRQVSRCCKLQGIAPDPLPWLRKAGFEDPERVARLYPHELSGGMAQRASIALVLARGSRFILADEPTTGLDPTVQERILKEILRLRDSGVGILFITHDLRIVPQIADHLLVMHDGRLVEKVEGCALNTLQSEPAKALWSATERIAGGVE